MISLFVSDVSWNVHDHDLGLLINTSHKIIQQEYKHRFTANYNLSIVRYMNSSNAEHLSPIHWYRFNVPFTFYTWFEYWMLVCLFVTNWAIVKISFLTKFYKQIRSLFNRKIEFAVCKSNAQGIKFTNSKIKMNTQVWNIFLSY